MRAVLCVRVVVFSEHCLLISFCRAVCRSRWVFLRWTYVHFIGRDMNCFFFYFLSFSHYSMLFDLFFSFVTFSPDFVLCFKCVLWCASHAHQMHICWYLSHMCVFVCTLFIRFRNDAWTKLNPCREKYLQITHK